LVEDLAKEGKNYCGTVVSNRKYFPKKMIEKKKTKRGDSMGAVCNKTGVHTVSWQDNGRARVNMVSSIGSPYLFGNCKRRVNHQTVDVPRPEIVELYNKSMGGVDHNDQLGASYPLEDVLKTRRWYKKLYLGLFGLSITNAFILWNLNCRDGLGEVISHEDFMLTVQDHLLATDSVDEEHCEVVDAAAHRPIFYRDRETKKRYDWCSLKHQPRCKVCAL
jgi:hypothetical protein